jgi:RNA polymerase sigma factor (sigma-70 family)
MLNDAELLRRYADLGDERAFTTLVERYVNLVYSSAQRQMWGDAHLAEDVSQAVFTALARKAGRLAASISSGKPLIGWLYTSTQLAASNLRRTAQRRQLREQTAHTMNPDHQFCSQTSDSEWADLRQLLDEAMSQLPQAERDAVLLRFFDEKDLRSVGTALGLSEEAARKRVSRALDRLRRVLAARGVSTTVAGLSATLTGRAVQVAPAGMAAKLAKTSLVAGTATTLTSTFGSVMFMTTQFKTIVAVTAILLFIGSAAYRFSRSNHETKSINSSVSTPVILVRQPTADVENSPRTDVQFAQKPAADQAIAGALAKIRAVLAAPGHVIFWPQPEMKSAIRELGQQYRQATPVLRQALHDPNWEIRRRAAEGLAFMGIAAPDAIPELIEMLRSSSTILDANLTAEALASIGVRGESLQDLTNALASNEELRGIVESRFPNFVNKVSQRGIDGVDDRLLNSAIANLTADGDDAHLSGLLSIANIGPVSIDAVPALNDFINQTNREDLKSYAEKLLKEIDPNFGHEREDPAFQEAQAARARAFSERARAGEATVRELITALRELPKAIPETAQALGAIGYDEMNRRTKETPQGQQELMDSIIMLSQIVNGKYPLDARVAAAKAFRQLQPMQVSPLYTTEEAQPAFTVITNAISNLSEEARPQIEASFQKMVAREKMNWTLLHGSGDMTDYSGMGLEEFARGLANVSQETYRDFVAAMQTTDPRFLQRP